MPSNQFQKSIFALLTVIITVHAYVFYSLYVLHGSTLMEITGQKGVLAAIHAQGGVYMLGTYLPIWALILIEFVFAFGLELFVGSPCSFKVACNMFDPKKTQPALFETAIICVTAAIMCPIMSFIASILYYPFYEGFHVLKLLANWLQLVCYNFPFAVLSQLFFIQPLVRTVFRFIFVRNSRVSQKHRGIA